MMDRRLIERMYNIHRPLKISDSTFCSKKKKKKDRRKHQQKKKKPSDNLIKIALK